jgi:tRNA threonylcarbamoyladenosine biosynthesis protein TsaB
MILHIETSGLKCSVAVSRDTELLSSAERQEEKYVHAEALHVFIKQCMDSARVAPGDLDAIHVSHGPGSYTGLRIGMSAAKGMAYALNIPLITTDTSRILMEAARRKHPAADGYIAMQDAGRMEVYRAEYDSAGLELEPPAPLILTEENLKSFSGKTMVLCGDGAPKCASFVEMPDFIIAPTLPEAPAMVEIGLRAYHCDDFADVAYCEPKYLKAIEVKVKKLGNEANNQRNPVS